MALSTGRLNLDDVTGPGKVGELLIRPLSSAYDTARWTSTKPGRIPLSYRDPLHASTDPGYSPEYTLLDGTKYPKLTQGAQYEFTVVRVNGTHDGTVFTATIPATASFNFSDLAPIPTPLPDPNAATDAVVSYLVTHGATGAAIDAKILTVAQPVDAKEVPLRSFLTAGQSLPNDGVANARPLLQLAIDGMAALYAIDGIPRVATIPRGVYQLSTPLTPAHLGGWGFRGAGRAETRFITPTNGAWINVPTPVDPWPGTPFYENISFSDFTIDGYRQTAPDWNTGNNMKGFVLNHVRNARFEHVDVVNTFATGFGIDYIESTSFTDCRAINCGRGQVLYFTLDQRIGAGSGFGLGAGCSAIESVTLINCVAINCGANGFFFEQLDRGEAVFNSIGFRMIGCHSEGNAQGFTDADGQGALVSASTFVNNLHAGVRVGTTHTDRQGGYNGTLSGCTVAGNGEAGVELAGTALGGYSITGCSIFKNAGAGIQIPASDTAFVARGLRIHGCRIVDNQSSGILFAYARPVVDVSIEDNEIRGNGRNTSATYRDGITCVSPMHKPNINYNRCARNGGRGLAFRGSGTVTTSPRVRGNDFDVSPGGSYLNEHTVADVSMIRGNINNQSATVTNLLTQPATQNSTVVGNWTSTGGTKSFDAGDTGMNGTGCALLTASGSGPARLGTPSRATVAGQQYTASMYLKAAAGEQVYFYTYDVTNNVYVSFQQITADGTWQRLAASFIASSTSMRWGVALVDYAANDLLRADWASITDGGDLWPYIDGTQPNSAWSGTAYSSQSVLTPPASTIPDYTDLSGGTMTDGANLGLGTGTGSKVGTAASQKLGLWGATPVVQPAATDDLLTLLANIGARAAGSAAPISTSGAVAFSGAAALTSSVRYNSSAPTTSTAMSAANSVPYQMVDATAGAVSMTLPATATKGIVYTFIKTDASANAVTIVGTINGATNYSLPTQYKRVTIVSSGTSGSWFIVDAG